jgi:hypothetical protein
MANTSRHEAPSVPRAGALRDGEDLPRARFLNELAVSAYVHLGHDRFAGEVDAATASALGDAVLVRADADGDELEAFVRLQGGVLALLDYGYGSLGVEVAGATRDDVTGALSRLRGALAQPEPAPSAVTFAFWVRDGCGGSVRRREIDASPWDEQRHNYAETTAAGLDALVAVERPERGRLILWHGAPGTGKTHALRALARAWREWCSPHCVLDPEALLSADPRYLLDVLAWDEDGSDGGDRWRLLVLEDAGELARFDAGRTTGMAQLLNLTDGLMGQGARTLVLITTNEPAATLHPAVRRPGRCLAEVEFAPLSEDEARRWLERAGATSEVTRPMALSELFALRDGADESTPALPAGRPAFGFARAILSEGLKPDLERVIS